MSWLRHALIVWVRRKKLYLELMALDDRELGQLGLRRRDIQDFVSSSYRVKSRPIELKTARELPQIRHPVAKAAASDTAIRRAA